MSKHVKPQVCLTAGALSLGRASRQTRGQSLFPAPDAGQVQCRDHLGPSAD
ncbi:hypothetical protein ATDW_24270 [Asticcacaulis sp. DW145]|uniref:hypothetical protein n=1 Tax=unclassified Asticcacaulis TaxID=2628350 RepID=UPI00260D9C25|nr:hypothetical protein [Asticcacaulis sp.]BEV11931.1 hypothetical protein ATDW_24270 [Asticcacaulis sp. DW145]